MSNVPEDLRYTDEHEWVKRDGDLLLIGITDHAQDQLGDVVFLELPEPGTALKKGEAFGVVESVKAVSDLYAPLDGEVTEANTDLVDAPEQINADAYGAWLVKMKPAEADEVDSLLDADGYNELLEKEAK